MLDLTIPNQIRAMERAVFGPMNDYHDAGRGIVEGQDIPAHLMQALREGEVITVVRLDGSLKTTLLMDCFGTLREQSKIIIDELVR